MNKRIVSNLLINSRFYVVVASLLLSFLTYFYLRINIVDPSLRSIRLQQLFSLYALVAWYFVLVVSAYGKIVSNKPWIHQLLHTRRAFGGMVAYFALLHAIITVNSQLGGVGGLRLLSGYTLVSLMLGLSALIVLLIMGLLSIDKIIAKIHFKYWKQLQIVSYFAGVATILHVWIIGSHLTSGPVRFSAFLALVVLFALQSIRLGLAEYKKYTSFKRALIVASAVWLVATGSLLVMKISVASYSKIHTKHSEEGIIIHAH